MFGADGLELTYIVWGFFVQLVLILHFGLRKWAFSRFTYQYGWIVYILAVPAFFVSLVLLIGSKPWGLWMAGFIYPVWAIYGYRIDYMLQKRWRNPINWRIGGPYVTLYMATIMFYWWPLGQLSRPLWYVYALLFIISTWLNFTSHHSAEAVERMLEEDNSGGPTD
jgi:hypothetical protein